ncbi:uncharacterized protein ATNIH1004_011296 [Aspergillus tanneri]|uniref:Protein kinase domain-containing protein n=1 Tax=Aspergillus tanneri TaxID=1220188 RepID=A0A5M9M5M7_9EURO|nr:uncharacterized protein ATNIH1004_011296 [Aspergillus tanneri]KAA8642352.1 hypothetical protein ATNIH1004_011296 [Aspergillus tanneri]
MSDVGDLFEDVSSPPAKDSEDTPAPEASCIVPTRGTLPGAFKKNKFPPATKRLFFPIIPDGGGLNCLAPATAGISAASFFKTLPLDALRVPVDDIVRTSHENLVNLQELYIGSSSVILTYDSWGISLQEICRASNIFAGNESAVATICKETLKGLQYVHDEIGIAHGNISCGTVMLTESGRVKIADVGDSMLQNHDPEEKIQDCQAVCQMAKVLLQLGTADKPATTLYLEAENFANAPFGTTIEELINHQFLNRGVESRSLQPFPLLLRILHSRS